MSLEKASVICKPFFEYNMSHYGFKMRIWKHFSLSLLLACVCAWIFDY